jgi:hypothetical protein
MQAGGANGGRGTAAAAGGQARALVALGTVQRLLRAVQEFGGQALRQRFQHGVDVFALGQHLAGAFQFGQAQRFAVFVQVAGSPAPRRGRRSSA